MATAYRLFAAEVNMEQTARAAGLNGQRLRNKLNPNQGNHRLTVDELVAITRASGNTRLIEGLMLDVGMAAVRLPAAGARGNLVNDTLALNAAAGALSAEVVAVREGGRVTQRVVGRVRQLIAEIETQCVRIGVEIEQAVPVCGSGLDAVVSAMVG